MTRPASFIDVCATTWRPHIKGRDPELDKIIHRRFGSDHDKPCANPNMLTCAIWECQVADRCRKLPKIYLAGDPLPIPPAPARARE